MEIKPHHIKPEVCTTRPSYREGKIPKCVKVIKMLDYLFIQAFIANLFLFFFSLINKPKGLHMRSRIQLFVSNQNTGHWRSFRIS